MHNLPELPLQRLFADSPPDKDARQAIVALTMPRQVLRPEACTLCHQIGRIIIVPFFVLAFYLPGFYGDLTALIWCVYSRTE